MMSGWSGSRCSVIRRSRGRSRIWLRDPPRHIRSRACRMPAVLADQLLWQGSRRHSDKRRWRSCGNCACAMRQPLSQRIVSRSNRSLTKSVTKAGAASQEHSEKPTGAIPRSTGTQLNALRRVRPMKRISEPRLRSCRGARVAAHHLRRLSEGAQKRASHALAVGEARLVGNHIHGMAALLHQQAGRLDA